MNKVLFLYQDENMPSSRIRVLNLLPELAQAGIRPYPERYPKRLAGKIKIIRRLGQFDAVYIQKKLLTPIEVLFFRTRAKKLIFDFDDAIYYKDDKNECLESRTRKTRFRHLVRHVDLVIAGNRILADYTSCLNKNVVVIPSAVETRSIPVKSDLALDDEPIVIGWVGGKGNLHHLQMLSPVFQKLSRKYRIRVHVLCNQDIAIQGVDVKYISWNLETQDQEVALFDIGVMPLPDNKWTEGKCGYKALQYMAAGVPPVCSDVGCNRDIVTHGLQGFVVSSIEGFLPAIETLIRDKELRRTMGTNARLKIEKQFSVSVVGRKLADELRVRILV